MFVRRGARRGTWRGTRREVRRGAWWRDRSGAWPQAVWRDAGMATAEYAMGTLAACAFAAVLYKVVSSGAVRDALQSLIAGALDAPF